MRRAALALALTCCAAGLPQVARADAPQTYVVAVCAAPSGAQPLAGWLAESGAAVDACAQGSGFGGSPDATGSLRWRYRVPDDVEIVALRTWRTGAVGEAGAYVLTADTEGRSARLESSEQLRESPTRVHEYIDLHAEGLGFELSCLPGCRADENWIRFSRMELVMRDAVMPRVIDVSGTAFVSRTAPALATVSATFKDIGGGVESAALLVDGVEVSHVAGKCSRPYAAAPCLLSGTQDFDLDTRSFADGPHSVAVAVTDVAGNRSVSRTYDVVVDNVPEPPPPAPEPPRPANLAVEWATVTSGYDDTPVVRARLRDAAGVPVPGLKVSVAVRSAMRGAPFVPDSPVVSDRSGRVTVQLPKGSSRQVRLTYGDQTATVNVVVHAPVRLGLSAKTTRNGSSIRFLGTVPGAQVDTKVELQARTGTKWVLVETVPLRQGHFSARYRFERTFQTTRYRFRAVIHSDPQFPYAAARSRVASVLVRP